MDSMLLPMLLQLDVPDDELLRRVRVLAAAEAAAAAAAAAAANGPASKGTASTAGGKKPASAGRKEGAAAASGAAGAAGTAAAGAVPPSHNNEKEFIRRLESFKQLLQEDAADLAAKVTANCAQGVIPGINSKVQTAWSAAAAHSDLTLHTPLPYSCPYW
jgi:hypothetical protein